MDERTLKTNLMKDMKKRGFFTYATHDTTRSGVPDVYGCKRGLSIWLELKYTESKTLGHPLTTQQSIFLRDINNAGGLGMVFVGLPDGMAHIERITEVGERKTFDYKPQTIDEALEWISNFATDFATPNTESGTPSSENIESLFDFL